METLIPRIKNTLNKFAIEQDVILKQDVHEEALSGILLGYFREEFADLEFDIDTQYNKRILYNELILKEAEFLIHKLPLKYWPINWEDGQKNIRQDILNLGDKYITQFRFDGLSLRVSKLEERVRKSK